jgi:hypothetical protein
LPPAVASGATVQVNCSGFTGSSFNVVLAAKSGDSDCEGTAAGDGTEVATVTVETRPTVQVTLVPGDDDDEFCETETETTHSFLVTATDLTVGELIVLEVLQAGCTLDPSGSTSGTGTTGTGQGFMCACDMMGWFSLSNLWLLCCPETLQP